MLNNLNICDHFSTKINSKNDNNNNNLNFGRKNSFELPTENSLSETNNNFQGKQINKINFIFFIFLIFLF